MALSLKTEIRHIPRQNVSQLGYMLQIGNSWKDIMGLIPNIPWTPENDIPSDITYERKYSSEDIGLIDNECTREGRTGFEILIEEWGTSGQKRPKVIDLINLLNKAELERASNYLLNITEKCPPDCICNTMQSIEACIKFPYSTIERSLQKGVRIGSGGFGNVFKVSLTVENNQKNVAIKVCSEKQEKEKEKLFMSEVDVLSQCNHENILKLEGFSISCANNFVGLVYSFMDNGCLSDCISCVNGSLPLSCDLRFEIALGTARGIVYLHTAFSLPKIHRDVKSANILLNKDFIPKLGDFGTARIGARGLSKTTVVNTVPIGTVMYMAPEAFRGDVSVKMDTFSFAVVLLELLTGLPIDVEEMDLLSYWQNVEKDNHLDLLDQKAGEWDRTVAQGLFHFCTNCTAEKPVRPTMVEALTKLEDILSHS